MYVQLSTTLNDGAIVLRSYKYSMFNSGTQCIRVMLLLPNFETSAYF